MTAPQSAVKPLATADKMAPPPAQRATRMPKFITIGLWLLSDAFGHAPWRLVFLVLLGFGGAALQAGVLLTLYWGTGILSEADLVKIPIVNVTLAKSTAFYLVAALIVLQAATAAICVYIYRVRTVYYWGRYQLHLSQRLLTEIARGVKEGRIGVNRLANDPTVIHVLSRNVQRMGLLFRRIVIALASLMRLLTFLALSLYVHAGVTLILLAGAGTVAAISILKFARDTSHKSRALRGNNQLARQEWRELVSRAGSGEAVTVNLDSIRGKPIGDFLKTFQARFINRERSRLLGMIAMVVLAAITMAVYGNAVLEGHAAWQDMTTAIVAVVLTMLPLSDLASVATIFGHYYPDTKVYRDLLDATCGSTTDEQFAKRLEAIKIGQGISNDDDDDDM